MNQNIAPYKEAMEQQTRNAMLLSSVIIDPQSNGLGGFRNDEIARNEAISQAASESPLFSAMGERGDEVAHVCASAIRDYERTYGELPSEAMLSLAYTQLDNLFSGKIAENASSDNLLSSLSSESLSTTKGIDVRANVAAIALPSLLLNPVNDAVTYIPNPKVNEVEIFNIERIAAESFGGLKKGEVINAMTHANFSLMRQRHESADQPDGAKKTITYDASTDGIKRDAPLVKKSVKVYANKELVAEDVQGNGNLFGSMTVGNTQVAVTGTVNYETGDIEPVFATAPANGVKVEFMFDLDPEADATLIPKVSHAMESFIVRPFQRVIAASASIMAMFKMSTEYSINQRSLNLQAMRQSVIDEKAKTQLDHMVKAVRDEFEFDATVEAGDDWRVVYEQFRAVLTKVSSHLVTETEVSGLAGLYLGSSFATFVKSLPSSMFEPVPNYQETPNIHYVGKLFGRFKIFQVPQETLLGATEALGYAKSDNVGKCGFLTGDVIPPTLYSHEVDKSLNKGETLWALGYDEVHPRDGHKFFVKVKLKNYSMA